MRNWKALVVAAGCLTPACGLNQQGVPPPADRISFPASALVDPGGAWLYVVNANSDLRYNNGTLVAIDLGLAASDYSSRSGDGGLAWQDCPQVGYVHPAGQSSNFCCWDLLDRGVLNCDDRRYVKSRVQIGSFGTGMVAQPSCGTALARHCTRSCPAGPPELRLFIGVRGSSSVTYVDVTPSSPPVFNCNATPGRFVECDAAHQVKDTSAGPDGTPTSGGAPPTPLPDEPYALALDPDKDLLYVGHLKGDITRPDSGGVSLFDVGGEQLADGRAPRPRFIAPFPSIFPSDGNGFFGVTSLNYHPGVGIGGDLFVTSRYLPRVGSITATTVPAGCPQAVSLDQIALVGTSVNFDTTLGGAEVRGVQFLPEGGRAYVLQRVPPALVGFDLASDAGGVRVMATDVLETCASPTFLQMPDPGLGIGSPLFVTCFESGQVYAFDPYVPRLTSVIQVGRGPAGLVFAGGPDDQRAYVVGFGDNNLSVIDLHPGSPTELHVIQRLGFPSSVPR